MIGWVVGWTDDAVLGVVCGGEMLVLHAREERHSRYSRYLVELLRLEGFADYAEADLSHLRVETLADHDLVILPRVATTLTQAKLLVDYVRNGVKGTG